MKNIPYFLPVVCVYIYIYIHIYHIIIVRIITSRQIWNCSIYFNIFISYSHRYFYHLPANMKLFNIFQYIYHIHIVTIITSGKYESAQYILYVYIVAIITSQQTWSCSKYFNIYIYIYKDIVMSITSRHANMKLLQYFRRAWSNYRADLNVNSGYWHKRLVYNNSMPCILPWKCI